MKKLFLLLLGMSFYYSYTLATDQERFIQLLDEQLALKEIGTETQNILSQNIATFALRFEAGIDPLVNEFLTILNTRRLHPKIPILSWQSYFNNNSSSTWDQDNRLKKIVDEINLELLKEAVSITADEFETRVLKAEKPVVVDVYATWCQPCQQMRPIFNELYEELGDEFDFVKINYDQETKDLLGTLGVTTLPTLLFIKDGKIVSKTEGLVTKEVIMENIKKLKA